MKIDERVPSRSSRGILALLVVLTGSPAAMGAQQRPPPGDRAQMERAIRERFETMVWRELGLDEGQREALAAAVQEFREPRRDVSQRQVRLERRLAGTGALLSEDQAREVLAELVAVKRAEVELLAREQERLLEVLTPPQLVRFYTLREQLGRRIRRLRENRPGGGGPPGRSSPAESLAGWPLLFQYPPLRGTLTAP